MKAAYWIGVIAVPPGVQPVGFSSEAFAVAKIPFKLTVSPAASQHNKGTDMAEAFQAAITDSDSRTGRAEP